VLIESKYFSWFHSDFPCKQHQ